MLALVALYACREKLNALSRTLSKVKAEKSRQIEDLEQAMAEMEKNKVLLCHVPVT